MSVCSDENMAVVGDLSQEDQPHIHHSTPPITLSAIACTIFHRDLGLKRCLLNMN